MALAVLITTDGTLKPLHDQKQATALYNVLMGKTEPANKKQADFLMHVKRIILPPSWKQAAGIIDDPEPDTSHIFHPGITQGKLSQMPTGDR